MPASSGRDVLLAAERAVERHGVRRAHRALPPAPRTSPAVGVETVRRTRPNDRRATALCWYAGQQELQVVGGVLREDPRPSPSGRAWRPSPMVPPGGRGRRRTCAVDPRLQRRHQSDIGDLEARARVRAPVHVDPDLLVEARQSRGELARRATWRGSSSRRSRACRIRSPCTPSSPCGTRWAVRGGPRSSRRATSSSPSAGSTPTITSFCCGGRGELSVAEPVGEVGDHRSWCPATRPREARTPPPRRRRVAA